jgi:hypothetical protein
LGNCATLGVSLLLAAGSLLQHLSLIWFTLGSILVHAGIMAAQALIYFEHRGHLLGDVRVLLLMAHVLAVLASRSVKVDSARRCRTQTTHHNS